MARGVGFIMIPLYTRYLSTEAYGTLELLDLTSYIVGMFLATGITQAIYRFYYEYEEEEKKKQVIGIALQIIWVNSLIGLPLLFLFSQNISNLVFESPNYFHLFNIIFATTVINLNAELLLAYLRIKKRSTLYICITTSKLVLNLSLNILFIVHYNMGVTGILVGGLLSSFATGLFLFLLIYRQIRFSYSSVIMKGMIAFGLPMIGNWLGMYVMNFADRFLLQRLVSLSEVGIYSLAYKFGMILNFLVLAPFLKVWGPMQFEMVKESDAKQTFSTLFTYFCLVEFFLGLGIAVLIKDVITIMADVEYHAAYQYVPLLLLAYIFSGARWIVQFGILLEKKTKYLAYGALIGAILNISINLILIPRFQVWGAVLATFISYVFFFQFTYYFSQKNYYIPYQFGRILKIMLSSLAIFVLADLVNPGAIAVSLTVKSLIVLSFPLVLYFLKFYTRDELCKLREIKDGILMKIRKKSIEKR